MSSAVLTNKNFFIKKNLYLDLKQRKYNFPCLDENAEWKRGCLLGGAQNLAKELMEFPANHLTPRLFAEQVINHMQGLPVEIIVR